MPSRHPGWLASHRFVPWIGALVALAGGIYSIYLFYLGLPTLMKCPQDQAIGYTVVCIIVAIVIGAVIGFAVASITGGANPGQTSSSEIEFDKNSPVGQLDVWSKKMEEASKQVEAAQRIRRRSRRKAQR